MLVIEAALNGGRDRSEQPVVPFRATELAVEAQRCVDAGASLVHVHARSDDGGWTAGIQPYVEAMRALRDALPGGLISITSIRPETVPVETILDLLDALAHDPATTPDLISINLGHIVAWEPIAGGNGRRTVHYPNAYDDIVRLLAACARHGIRPELGVMDLGFVSNAVALREDGLLPAHPWFLLELDSPAYGAGPQVAPATVANYDVLAAAIRDHVPSARWAAHGQGMAGYAVIKHAMVNGAHVRVGFEDAVYLPDGRLAASNADLVAWSVATARNVGREPALFEEARMVVRSGPRDP